VITVTLLAVVIELQPLAHQLRVLLHLVLLPLHDVGPIHPLHHLLGAGREDALEARVGLAEPLFVQFVQPFLALLVDDTRATADQRLDEGLLRGVLLQVCEVFAFHLLCKHVQVEGFFVVEAVALLPHVSFRQIQAVSGGVDRDLLLDVLEFDLLVCVGHWTVFPQLDPDVLLFALCSFLFVFLD